MKEKILKKIKNANDQNFLKFCWGVHICISYWPKGGGAGGNNQHLHVTLTLVEVIYIINMVGIRIVYWFLNMWV